MNLCVCDVCPEATPSDSWGGRASLCETHPKLWKLTSFSSPRAEGAGPGGWGGWGLGGGGCLQEGLYLEGSVPIWSQWWGGKVHRDLLTGGPGGTPGPLGNGIKSPTCTVPVVAQ